MHTSHFTRFLDNLTPAQRAALMDVLASHVENVEVDTCDEPLPAEHGFIVNLSDTLTTYVAIKGE